MAVGSFCLVLHGHLPYVLRHGVWPHGEDWLFEAAAETYLPLLAMIDECVYFNAQPHITVGLTPVLLEQLSHEQFRKGFEKYLADRVERARLDEKEFKGRGEEHLAWLAQRWGEWYGKRAQQFADVGRDIPAAFGRRAREGLIEILTSAATHAYLPLLFEDSCVRAQLRAGSSTSERILGLRPKGLWLPECAYRQGGPWSPPIVWSGKDNRLGIERMIADEGLTHFFVEDRLIKESRSECVFHDWQWRRVDWNEAANYPQRGWRSVNETNGVFLGSTGESPLRVLARDTQVCEQVWSGAIGYPADGVYLEFHKKHGERRGLRYWKITGKGVDLGQKREYHPDDVDGKIHEHAHHFCNVVKGKLQEHSSRTGRHGVITASFDAELFGHWWFEGPRFLRDVLLTLNADPDVDVLTAQMLEERHPPDKVVSLPEGSWGEGGDHRVWANPKVNWMWEIEYRCEAMFGKLTFELPWRRDPQIRQLLEKAGRELLLLQASDWWFVITRGQAVDYGIKRFMLHVARFETLLDLCSKLAQDSTYLGKLDEVERHEVADADLHDVIFPQIDLSWWSM